MDGEVELVGEVSIDLVEEGSWWRMCWKRGS